MEMRDPLQPARAAFAQGRIADSRRHCRERLAVAPHDAEALHLAAIVELQSGAPAAALELIDRAISQRPGDPRAQQTRGLILSMSGARAEAIAAFREALRLDPAFADAHASLGLALLQSGDAAGAVAHLEKAVAMRAMPQWQYNLALAQARLGRPDAAQGALRAAIAGRPDFAPAHGLLGTLLMQQGDAASAETAFRSALAAGANAADVHNNLGAALMALGRFGDAESSLRASLAIDPRLAHAWNNLGNVVRRAGRREEAQSSFREAVRIDPAFAPAWVNLGNALRESGRYDEAIEALERALSLDPDSAEAHLSKAICHLVRGELEAGWAEYRWRAGAPPRGDDVSEFARRVESREPIEIVGEQGLGDALFFLRWAQPLANAGAKLAFRGDARLHPLLAPSGVFAKFSARETNSPSQAGTIAAGDLPRLARGKAPSTPPPFVLRPDDALVRDARTRLASFGAAPYIGVCWRAGIANVSGAEHLSKRIDPAKLGAALRESRGTLVSVQRGPERAEAGALEAAAGRKVYDCSADNDDLARMLALLAILDDYVGVSSTNIHLRAGLARPARILVPLPPEWRYGAAGERSAWFPQFTLYREDRDAAWDPALDRLARDLREAA